MPTSFLVEVFDVRSHRRCSVSGPGFPSRLSPGVEVDFMQTSADLEKRGEGFRLRRHGDGFLPRLICQKQRWRSHTTESRRNFSFLSFSFPGARRLSPDWRTHPPFTYIRPVLAPGEVGGGALCYLTLTSDLLLAPPVPALGGGRVGGYLPAVLCGNSQTETRDWRDSLTKALSLFLTLSFSLSLSQLGWPDINQPEPLGN